MTTGSEYDPSSNINLVERNDGKIEFEPASETEPGGYMVYFGQNYKPQPRPERGREKRCAERNTIEGALANDCKAIVAIVTVSKEQTTGEGREVHDVLHPCRDCRDLLRDLIKQGKVRDDSMVLNARDVEKPDGSVEWITKEQTVRDLLNLYPGDNVAA